jgi:hypothetical protein
VHSAGGALDRLRNQSVFHNDDVVMENGLLTLALDEYVLVAGDTTLAGDIYYPLADIAPIHHALSVKVSGYHVLREMSALLDQVAGLGTLLCKGIDSLHREVLPALGCSYHEE